MEMAGDGTGVDFLEREPVGYGPAEKTLAWRFRIRADRSELLGRLFSNRFRIIFSCVKKPGITGKMRVGLRTIEIVGRGSLSFLSLSRISPIKILNR
jgi:hypothetical protein